jgi:3-hydroxybutyryl-CoA dehydrogenase
MMYNGNPADRPSPTIVEKFTNGEWGKKQEKVFTIMND